MNTQDLSGILFLDIETVPQQATFNNLDERFQKLWERKSSFLKGSDTQTPDELYHHAGIYAEFGKIVSIATGYFREHEDGFQLRIKAFSNHDERVLLQEFVQLFEHHFTSKKLKLCAHNGKEFDFPYIARRMIINNIELPEVLNLSGRKPWEVPHIDTLELWKFGDYKHYTSLDQLAAIFDIPTSKDDIDGSQVYSVYYEENDLDRITQYCKKDIKVLAQVYLRLCQLTPLQDSEVVMI